MSEKVMPPEPQVRVMRPGDLEARVVNLELALE